MKCRRCGQPLFGQHSLAALISLQPLIDETLCNQCRELFARIDQQRCCPDCGRAEQTGRCRDCLRWAQLGVPPLQNRGLYLYNDAMKELIQQYKGIGDYNLRTCFAADVERLRMVRGATFVPLPTEAKHFAVRGFDPVVGLFGTLPLKMWLAKADTEQPQAQKNRAARLQTPQSFRCVVPAKTLNRTRLICLLDDLYTTGTTLHHAAAAIRDAGYSGKVISRTLIR